MLFEVAMQVCRTKHLHRGKTKEEHINIKSPTSPTPQRIAICNLWQDNNLLLQLLFREDERPHYIIKLFQSHLGMESSDAIRI